MRKHFKILVAGRSADPVRNPGVVRRLQLFFEGLLATAFILGTLIAAILIGTTITLALWTAAAITLAAVIIRGTFRRRIGNLMSGRTRADDGTSQGDSL